MGKPSDNKESPAERYEALLRGEIDVGEYVQSLRQEARFSTVRRERLLLEAGD